MITVVVSVEDRSLTPSTSVLGYENDNFYESIQFYVPQIFENQVVNVCYQQADGGLGVVVLDSSLTWNIGRGITSTVGSLTLFLRVISDDDRVWNSNSCRFKIRDLFDVDAENPPFNDPDALEAALAEIASHAIFAVAARDDIALMHEDVTNNAAEVQENTEIAAAASNAASASASQSAEQAASSAESAASALNSANDASASAEDAADQASQAGIYAVDASHQAQAAAQSASSAASSASQAEERASAAAQSASAASQSGDSAARSASSAANSASSAASSASQASSSASQAASSASQAAQSASAAEEMESQAASSASSAAQSAAAAQDAAQGLENPQVRVTTLAPGSQATAQWQDNVLALGIPRGYDGEGSGDMMASTYDADGNGVVDAAESLTGTVEMNQVTGLSDEIQGLGSALNDLDTNKASNTYVNSHVENKNNPHGVTAAQAGARPDTWLPTASDVGADPAGTASSAVSAHNVDSTAHFAIFESVANAMEYVVGLVNDKADSSALDEHTSNKSNPHAVTASQVGAATTALYTATLTAAGWTGSEAPYSQTLSVTGLLASDTPFVDVIQTGTEVTDSAVRSAWGAVIRMVAAANSLTGYASEIPEADIPIQIKVVR